MKNDSIVFVKKGETKPAQRDSYDSINVTNDRPKLMLIDRRVGFVGRWNGCRRTSCCFFLLNTTNPNDCFFKTAQIFASKHDRKLIQSCCLGIVIVVTTVVVFVVAQVSAYTKSAQLAFGVFYFHGLVRIIDSEISEPLDLDSKQTNKQTYIQNSNKKTKTRVVC